jgi:hypothetical protein
MKKYLQYLLGIGFVYSVFNPVNAGEIWSTWTKVTMLYPASNVLIFYTEYSNSLSTCNSGTRFRLDITNEDYKTQVAVLTMAYATGKEVKVNINDEQEPNCNPIVNRFLVR